LIYCKKIPEKSKRIRDRISSESAENTALIIGIVAGALIAVILVVLLVLKLKKGSTPSYKVDERGAAGSGKMMGGGKGAPPSHSNSNAALLNTSNTGGANLMGSTGGMMGRTGTAPLSSINPALAGLEKKTSPQSKKTGKDIKEWYV